MPITINRDDETNWNAMAVRNLEQGTEHPFDMAHEGEGAEIEGRIIDWAVIAARGIMRDLIDRYAVKDSFKHIDLWTRVDIIESMAATIRAAREITSDRFDAAIKAKFHPG